VGGGPAEGPKMSLFFLFCPIKWFLGPPGFGDFDGFWRFSGFWGFSGFWDFSGFWGFWRNCGFFGTVKKLKRTTFCKFRKIPAQKQGEGTKPTPIESEKCKNMQRDEIQHVVFGKKTKIFF